MTTTNGISDPLSYWNDGPAKQRITEAIASMTDETSASYVEPRRRIATFDNDGTLWCEKPTYAQFMLLLGRWQAMVKEDPALRETQPYQAAVEGDFAWFADLYAHLPELLAGVGEAFGGITPDEFEQSVTAFFGAVNHPRFGMPFHHLTYLPMVQLLHVLRDNGFKVLITTGGGRDFVRVVSEEIYDLPREAIIGSSVALEYKDGQLIRGKTLGSTIDDGPGKPVHIFERTGFAPAFAGGNANGDIQMLESAQFALLVHHDDEAREYAYDQDAEKALALAPEQDWLVVSMKSDFAQMFPPPTD